MTTVLSIHLEDTVSAKTVRRELHKFNFHGRTAVAKILIAKNITKRRKIWCDDHITCTSDDCKYAKWPDEKR